MGFVLHSILLEGPQVQVSYHDSDAKGPSGFEIRTPVMVIDSRLQAELAEVSDAALQLVTAWAGLMREETASP